MPSSWQTRAPAQQSQPLSFSLQLQPATDTDAGNIAAIPPDSDATPAAASVITQAAQCHDVSSEADASASNSMQLGQSRNGQKGLFAGPEGLHQRQSRLSNRQSSRQHASTSRSDCMVLGAEDCSDQVSGAQQPGHCSPTDFCNAWGGVSMIVGSQGIDLDQQIHGSPSARLSGPGHSQVQHMQPAEADRVQSSLPAVGLPSATVQTCSAVRHQPYLHWTRARLTFLHDCSCATSCGFELLSVILPRRSSAWHSTLLYWSKAGLYSWCWDCVDLHSICWLGLCHSCLSNALCTLELSVVCRSMLSLLAAMQWVAPLGLHHSTQAM